MNKCLIRSRCGGLRNFVAVARVTLQRRWLVKQNGLFADELDERVTLVTFHVCMAAGERHFRAFVVIECGWHPALRIMTRLARRFSRVVFELAAMRLDMARLAIRCCALELDFVLSYGNLVARAAGNRAMRAEKREFRFCVIKAVHVGPGFRVVTGFAAEDRSVRPLAIHAVVKFAMVRIGVASGAGHVIKMKWKNFVRAMRFPRGVAIRARNGGMRPGQWKPRVAMHRDGIERAMKIRDGVAGFTTILVGGSSELIVVDVFVAIGAIREFHFILRVFPRRSVALGAFDGDVFTLQRILRRRVLLDSEKRRLPRVDVVALRALALLRTAIELARVNVLVAVLTIRKRKRFLEIAAGMASDTRNFRVPAEQRELGPGVIKFKL